MRRGLWLVRSVCVLTLTTAMTAHAQQAEEPPPWETGSEDAPAAEASLDDEAPPGFETPSGDAEPDDAEPADEGGSAFESRAELGLIVGGKIGVGLGTGAFGATPVFELELGYAPDLGDSIGRSLEIFLIGQYAQPGLDGSSPMSDPRLAGGAPFSYDVTQQMLSLSLGALYRLDVGSDLLMPYGGLGGRLYLLNTDVTADVMGEPLGASNETRTQLGLVLLGGVELFVGPGALLGELSFGWAPLDAYIMRETNLGALSLAVGYRVML